MFFQKVQKEQLATVFVMASAVLFGVLGYAGTKLIDQNFSITNMLFWRFSVATLWLILVNLKKTKYLSHRTIKWQPTIAACILGSIFYTGGSLLYFLASSFIGTGLAMVMFFTFPLFVVLFSCLFQAHIVTPYMLFALLAIVIGLFLLHGSPITLHIKGIIFALLAAIAYAIYFYRSKQLTRELTPYQLALLVCASCSITFLIISLLTKSFVLPNSLQTYLYIGILGVVTTALPIQLLLEGLKFVSPPKAAILSVLQPVVTLLMGIFALGESVTSLQTIGAALILLSAVLIQFEKEPQRVLN